MTPVKILFVAADPYSCDPNLHPDQWDPRLALDEDFRAIRQRLRDAERRGALTIISCLAARPDDLLHELNDVRPHVVHFSGHASADGLILVGEDGGPHGVVTDALVRLFRSAGRDVRLVVLSACESDPIAAALASVVECAVGMHGGMPDDSALVFNASLYRALAFGRSVKDAFEQGQTALAMHCPADVERPLLVTRPGVDPAEVVLVPEWPDDPAGGTRQTVTINGSNNQVNIAGRDLHAHKGDIRPSRSDSVCYFTNVWYLPKRLRFWQPVNAAVGTLTIRNGRAEFRDDDSRFTIGEIHDVEHTRMGGDISNNWVRLEYGDRSAPREAYFSHRTRLGIDALLGGSDELFDVLRELGPDCRPD